MRTFVSVGIPVRMGIAKGTCHFQRFGIDTYQNFSVTRSMFYGSGIVYSNEAEKYGGNRHGGNARNVMLPDLGIRGNTHFSMLDLNNVRIADLLSEFLKEKGLDR